MFEKITPEEAGLSSHRIKDFILSLNRRGLAMHSVLIAKGDKLVCEAYWKPFDKDFCHRMYSQTKSYVGIGIGLLIDEGKLSLDDTVASYFPDKLTRDLLPEHRELTVRDMLLMRTAGGGINWFASANPDRTAAYFNDSAPKRRAHTLWEYDSAGSQVLCSLIERLSGMSFFDYMYEKIFKHLGTFKTAEVLKTRNGDAWGDSALVCTPRDMVSFAHLLMKYGVHDGKRLLSEAYVREATSPLADNNMSGFVQSTRHGYGYQIWCYEKGFGFNGMGGQFTVVIPENELIFVCTADNQGNTSSGDLQIGGFFDHVAHHASAAPLPADPEGVRELEELIGGLTLVTAAGKTESPLMEKIGGRTYVAAENRTGITRFSFTFAGDGTGEFRYTNAQGDKILPFGIGKNVFTKFPQLGYSDAYGGTRTENGFTYRCASSLAFAPQGDTLHLRVQIIDRYFGNMFATFAFRDGDVTVRMSKNAEAFLDEYYGTFTARVEE